MYSPAFYVKDRKEINGDRDRERDRDRGKEGGSDNYKIGSASFEAAASIRWLALGQSDKIIFLSICAKL